MKEYECGTFKRRLLIILAVILFVVTLCASVPLSYAAWTGKAGGMSTFAASVGSWQTVTTPNGPENGVDVTLANGQSVATTQKLTNVDLSGDGETNESDVGLLISYTKNGTANTKGLLAEANGDGTYSLTAAFTDDFFDAGTEVIIRPIINASGCPGAEGSNYGYGGSIVRNDNTSGCFDEYKIKIQSGWTGSSRTVGIKYISGHAGTYKFTLQMGTRDWNNMPAINLTIDKA